MYVRTMLCLVRNCAKYFKQVELCQMLGDRTVCNNNNVISVCILVTLLSRGCRRGEAKTKVRRDRVPFAS